VLDRPLKEKGKKVRGGNFSFRLELPEAFVVHRGVSQGGKKLTADTRRTFWQSRCRKVEGVELGNGKVAVSLTGLRMLKEKHLVIVSHPERPRVWTFRRIMESAERTQTTPTVGQGASMRRGGLKL